MSNDAPAGYGTGSYPAPGAPTGAYAQPAGPYPATGPVAAPAHPTSAGQDPYASWGQRVGASLLDGLLDSAAYLVGSLVFVLTLRSGVGADGVPADAASTAGVVALGLGALVSLGVTAWNRWLRQGRTGRSVGKQVLGIRLVSTTTGEPIGGGMAFLRDIAHTLDGFLYVGYLWPLWDPQKQTFADKIVSTVVVRDR